MSDSPSHSLEKHEDEQDFANLVEEITQKVQGGQRVDVDSYVRKHPEYGEQLRELFPAMRVLTDLAASVSGGDSAAMDMASDTVSKMGRLGDFRILREIGRGGMGVVYEAEQVSLGRRVALKVLPFAAVLDPRHLQRFKNEAQAAAALEHPNIVNIYSVGCERGVHYYAMQFIEGQTLAQVIEELRHSSPLPSAGEGPGVRAAGVATSVAPRPDLTPAPTTPLGAEQSPLSLRERVRVRAAGEMTSADSAPHPGPLPKGEGIESAAHLAPEPRTLNPPGPTRPGSERRTLNPPGPTRPGSERSFLPADTQREVQAAVSTKGPHRTREFFRSVAQLGIQAAEALEHAHQMGVVHRDIKPSNLMVSSLPSPAGRGAGGEGPHLWVTDFGLALTHTGANLIYGESWPAVRDGPLTHTGANLTMTGDILGTLRYMSPEQAAGKSRVLDHHTDIYSLGLTLYELLTLRPAFEGDDRQHLVRQILEADPPPPRHVNQAIPKDLETILLKATAKEPAARYPTAQALADDLRRFLDDKPIRARRPSLVERAAKWSRRHKPVVGSAAVLLVAAVIATVVVAWNRYQKVLQIQEHLTAAGAFLQSGDYVAADRELAEARGRLGAVFYPSRGLAADLAGLTGQVSGKKEAEERFQRFQEYRQSVHANMYNATPNTMDRVQENCRAALALYRVFDSSRLEGQEGFELLSPQRQAMLKEAVAELLFAWAEMEAAKEQEPKDLPEAHRRTIAALERIERFYRPIPAVYLWIAQSRRALGDAEAARQAEKQAAAHRPVSGLDYFILGEFHFMCEDQPDKALADYSLALRRQPDHYLSLLASGLTLWERERHEEAIAMLTGAIAVNPRTSIAYIWRAHSCTSLGQYGLANADVDAAMVIAPQDYHAYWILAQLRRMQGGAAAGLAMYDKAVAMAPTTPAALLNERARNHAFLGNRDKALADFSRVIEWLRPRLELAQSIRHYRGAMNEEPHATYIRACEERSKIYKQLGQLDKAEDDLKEALRPAPKSAASWMARGDVEREQRDFDKAIASFNQAIRLDPQNAYAYFLRGASRFRKGDYDRAIADYTQSIRLNPKDYVIYTLRAQAYSEKRQFERAIADMEEAIDLAPDRPDVCNHAAWLLVTCPDHQVWNPPRAVELAKKATDCVPGISQVWRTLGVAQYRAGDYEAAIKALGKSMELGSGGVACDWFFLAMAHWQLKHTEEARRWHDKGAAWMEKNKSSDDELLRFRAEAETLIKGPSGQKPKTLPEGKEKPGKTPSEQK